MTWSVFEIFAKQKEIVRLEKESSLPAFWNDTNAARNVMRRLGSLTKHVDEWLDMEAEALELFELAKLSAEDRSLNSELESEVTALISKIEQAEFNLALNGPYDNRNAILAVHAGAGGVESMDWAQMLLNMYLKWAESHGFQTEILDSSIGEEAGIKSAVVQISGD